jgi:glycine dehydrogenase subunit 1
MSYTPHTEADKKRMLDAIGASSVEDLFRHVPEKFRSTAKINLPDGVNELTVRQRLAALAAKNAAANDWDLYLGGGIYHHFIPSAVDAIISRSEFSTSYTPYQPEVSQGTLQALFEYQTLICQLTGMEVSNAGIYDGASASAEAILMSRRIQSPPRRRVLVSRALHPQYRAVLATYLRNLTDVSLEEIPFDGSGATDIDQVARRLNERTMCVLVGYPNFFGVIENLAPLHELCQRAGAQLITATTEPLAFGVLKPPGAFGVDIAVGEGQSLGVPMALGGPGFGFFATQRKFMRNLPGRLVGETVDGEGRRGYVLTLATREQHIRREKATSNICTSQTLCTTAATVYMAFMGKTGMRRLAEVNVARAHEAYQRLIQDSKVEGCFTAPFFNEFVVRGKQLDEIMRRCAERRIMPGISLAKWYPELPDCLLVCVTEMNDREGIDRLVRAISN